MTKDEIHSVIECYEITLNYELDTEPIECRHELIITEREEKLNHCSTMIPKMYEFLKEFDNPKIKDKLYRWLGFIQGVLWSEGVFSLDSLRSHNKNGVDNSAFSVVTNTARHEQ